MSITQDRIIGLIKEGLDAEAAYNDLRKSLRQAIAVEADFDSLQAAISALLTFQFTERRSIDLAMEDRHFKANYRRNIRAAQRQRVIRAIGDVGAPTGQRRAPKGDTVTEDRLEWGAEDDNTVRDEDLEKFNNGTEELL